MAHFDDLEPCTAFPGEWKNLLAVGWLAKGHEYSRGALDRELLRALAQIYFWQPPGASTSLHRCDLCGADRPVRAESGAYFVPGEGVLYAAPRMISHYMLEHDYSPPSGFARAVMNWREPRVAEAFQAVLARHLVGGTLPPPRPPRDADGNPPIIVLEGIEPVRIRPGMYIGGTDAAALGHMLFEVVGNSIDQHLAGTCTRISIDIDEAGWVCVEDDGSGISVEVLPEHGRSILELAFTRLHFTPTLDGHNPHVHIRAELAGVGVSVVSALSERLEVESRSGGLISRAAFERGRVVEPLARLGPGSSRGTRIRYLPDEVIFGQARHDLAALESRLRQLAGLCPKLDLRFQGKSLQRPEGLMGWIHELAPDAVQETALFTAGTFEDVFVETAFAWSPSGTEARVLSFVNCSKTPEAGSHVKGLLAALEAVPPNPKDKKKLLRGLVAVVHVSMLHPKFGGPTRSRLEFEAARRAVHEVVARAIVEAPWWWDRLHEKIG